MQSNSDDSVTVTSTQNDEALKKLDTHGKKRNRKKTTLIQLLQNICVSPEKSLEWLKIKGLIPKALFCPKCNNRMKYEANNQSIDGYMWICKECTTDPPHISARNGSWLESRDYPLPSILLYTYLWVYDYTLDQISKETNLPLSIVEEWHLAYCDICHSFNQKKSVRKREVDLEDGNNPTLDKESTVEMWRKKNESKDLFLQFLRDADSL